MRRDGGRIRIGIDGHVLGKNIGGVERYVDHVVRLVPSLLPQHDFVVFVGGREIGRLDLPRASNLSVVSLPVSDPMIQRSVVLPWAVRRHRIDILQVQRIAPWVCGSCKLVLTIHDLIPLLQPEAYPGFRNRLVRLLTPGSLRRADLILCPTDTVCKEVVAYDPSLRAPCRPFYLGADRDQFARPSDAVVDETLARHAIDRPFIYSPGAIEQRKNLEVLIGALARLDPPDRPLLVLSGAVRDQGCFDRLLALATDLGVRDDIHHLGFLPEADLAVFYSAAVVCVAASRDEGFNLMPLEAMSCGARVLCSDIPVHREIYAGGVTFFAKDDPKMLADLIAQSGPASFGPDETAGREACLARLSWDAMAQRMAAMFDDMARTVGRAAPHIRRRSTSAPIGRRPALPDDV